jgi:TolB protein
MRFRGLRAVACLAVAALLLALGVGRAASAAPLPPVGPGSALVLYAAAGSAHQPAADTLYLVDPAGDRYPLARIPDSDASAGLIAWASDGTRALVELPGGAVDQVTLADGQVSRVSLPAGVTVLGYYNCPDGLGILGESTKGGVTTLARYTLDGALAGVLATWPSSTAPAASPVFGTAALEAPSGAFTVLPGTAALSLVSSLGGGSRELPLPVNRSADCAPVRWWRDGVVLAECSGPGIAGPRLWLVPASGAQPIALTPQRGQNGPDYGDINGWRIPGSGLYVQALASCGPPFIAAAHPNGTVTPLLIPGVVVTQSGQWLLTEQAGGCLGSTSLLWFDPVTHAERWVFHTPAADSGIISATAFAS